MRSETMGSYIYNCAGSLSLEPIKCYFLALLISIFVLTIFLINLITFE